MKSLITMALGTAFALASGVSSAQNGDMMNGSSTWGAGWMGGWVRRHVQQMAVGMEMVLTPPVRPIW